MSHQTSFNEFNSKIRESVKASQPFSVSVKTGQSSSLLHSPSLFSPSSSSLSSSILSTKSSVSLSDSQSTSNFKFHSSSQLQKQSESSSRFSFSFDTPKRCLCTALFLAQSESPVHLVSPITPHTCLLWNTRKCEIEKLALLLLSKYPDASCTFDIIHKTVTTVVLQSQYWSEFNFDPLYTAGATITTKEIMKFAMSSFVSSPLQEPIFFKILNRSTGMTEFIFWDQLFQACITNISCLCHDYISSIKHSLKARAFMSPSATTSDSGVGIRRKIEIITPTETPRKLLSLFPPCIQTLIQVGEMKDRCLLSSYLPYTDTANPLNDIILYLVDIFDSKRTQRSSHVQSARHTSEKKGFRLISYPSHQEKDTLNRRFTDFVKKVGIESVYRDAIRQHEQSTKSHIQGDSDPINIYGLGCSLCPNFTRCFNERKTPISEISAAISPTLPNGYPVITIALGDTIIQENRKLISSRCIDF